MGEFGIRVNSIHPYSIDTPMVEKKAMMDVFAKYPSYPAQLRAHALPAGEPRRQEGTQEFMMPEEVSDVVAWLASDGSATISGSQIAVDRGTAKF